MRLQTSLVLALVMITGTAQAQSLTLPTIAAASAAGADWATTYHGLTRYPGTIRETNPLMAPMQGNPTTLVAVGATIDTAGLVLWNRYVGRKHPKLAAVGLWAMAGVRTYMAARNLQHIQIVGRR